MPEGDNILRAAKTLHAALAGRAVTRYESRLAKASRDDMVGRTIEKVTAQGKNLLMHFSGGLVLRTHLRMNGSWHLYRPGEKWQRTGADMRLVIETDAFVAVGFHLPVAEFDFDLRHLGPDLLGEAFDEDEAVRRLRARENEPLGDLVIDQRVMAGAGNVFRSEICFLFKVLPTAPASRLSDEQLRELVRRLRALLQQSVRTGVRRTTKRDDPLYVYGRSGEPCRVCGTAIDFGKFGPGARVTYWCRKCQT